MTPDVSWQSLSIDAPGAPPAPLDRTGAVALVPAGDRAFAAAAALTLARSLARGGRRVFLCDLDLADPRLHTMAGVARGVGVTDFVSYGASPAHVVTELEDRLLFVSAGTPVVAFEGVLASDRWEALVEAATHARACLLLFVAPDLRGVEKVLARAETLVALGRPDQLPDLGEAGDRLHLGFHPLDDSDASPGADEAVPDVLAAIPEAPALAAAEAARAAPPAGHTPDDDALVDDVWAADPAAIGPDPDGDEPAMSLAAATAVNRAARKSPPKKNRVGLWFFLVFLVLVIVVVLGWFGLIRVPGIVPRRADAGESVVRQAAVEPDGATAPDAAVESPPASVAPDAAPGGVPVQAWALRLGAFRDRGVARGEADRMAASAPGHLFIVVPVEVSGNRWYRVVSAQAVDEAAAEADRVALAAALQAPDADRWLVRAAPLAYLVAESPEVAEARRRADELASRGVDAYVLRVSGDDGPATYRVYAGAYANAAEAGAMRSLLDGVGLADAPLVERRGILPE